MTVEFSEVENVELGVESFLSKLGSLYNFSNECAYTAYLIFFFPKFSESNQHNLFMSSSEYTHMRIEDKDEKGEGYLVIESKEDLEEFRKMLIEAYYELNPDRKRPCETRSPK